MHIEKPKIIALEGPSHAGKSTLLNALKSMLVIEGSAFLPDYVEFAGGPLNVPSTPGNAIDETAALLFFLQMEVDRLGKLLSGQKPLNLCLLDRSVHTLLAHRYAIQNLYDVKCFDIAVSIVERIAYNFYPHHIFYIDTPESLLKPRRIARINAAKEKESLALQNLVFDKPEYICEFRSYFFNGSILPDRVTLLDGTVSVQNLAQEVQSFLIK